MSDVLLPTARDWMFPSPFTLAPDQDLFTAMDLLLKHKLAAAPVVDAKDHLLGMLTEKDCLRVLSNVTFEEEFLEGGKVEDFQSAIRLVCEPTMDIFRAVEMFLATNFPLLPVVEQGRLCGLISRQAMLQGIQAFRRQLEQRRMEQERFAGRQADRPRGIERMQRLVASQTREQLVRLFGRRAS